MEGFDSRIAPEKFRQKIAGDAGFQLSFAQLAARLVLLIRQVGKLGGQALVVPQLEDNQTNAGFLAMLKLAEDALPAAPR